MKTIRKAVVGGITIAMTEEESFEQHCYIEAEPDYSVETTYHGKCLRLYECDGKKDAEHTFNTIRDTIQDCGFLLENKANKA